VVVAIGLTVIVMLVLFLSDRRLAWPWYVPLGTLITVGTGLLMASLPKHRGVAG
jgi:hypothetical protein